MTGRFPIACEPTLTPALSRPAGEGANGRAIGRVVS
jgi:hypothetical protein